MSLVDAGIALAVLCILGAPDLVLLGLLVLALLLGFGGLLVFVLHFVIGVFYGP